MSLHQNLMLIKISDKFNISVKNIFNSLRDEFIDASF